MKLWDISVCMIFAFCVGGGAAYNRFVPLIRRFAIESNRRTVYKMKRTIDKVGDGTVESVAKKKAKDSSSSIDEPPAPFAPSGFQVSRARLLTTNNRTICDGNCVVLWMSRDQRVFDNHAIHYAQSMAKSRGLPLRVVFNLVPRFLDATLRQYSFMVEGLKEVESQLRNLDIPFHLLFGNPLETVPQFVKEKHSALLVTDFSPLRVGQGWVRGVSDVLDSSSSIPVIQVDAHNIVPCWVASPKLEYSARTFRGKIVPKIAEYLREVPPPTPNPSGSLDIDPIDWDAAMARLEINRDVGPVSWIRPGYTAAQEMLNDFIVSRLKDYGENRNDPNKNAVSHLSPYIHFGHLSVEKAVITLKAMKKGGSSVDSFIEEAVVRRELTDNFCYCKFSPFSFVPDSFAKPLRLKIIQIMTPWRAAMSGRKKHWNLIAVTHVRSCTPENSLKQQRLTMTYGMPLNFKW